MPALWLPDSGGVSRKQKEVWLPDTGGVKRKQKELWTPDIGGVKRKIFSSGVEYELSGSCNEISDRATPWSSFVGGKIEIGQSLYYSDYDQVTLQVRLHFSDPISVSAGTQIISLSGSIYNEDAVYALRKNDGAYPNQTGLFVKLNNVPNVTDYQDVYNFTRILSPEFGSKQDTVSFANIAYNAPANVALTDICLRLQCLSGRKSDFVWRNLVLDCPAGSVIVLGQPLIAGPTGYLNI